MAYVCLEADECRVFIKNGKLRFQARRVGHDGVVAEQVTITLPKEMAGLFTSVEQMDEEEEQPFSRNRISDIFKDRN